MKIVNIDDLKITYKKALEQKLIDNKRGIDLSEYAEEPAKLFNNMLDNLPVTDVLDKIRTEIDRQEKWLMDAGYTAYNVDIAFSAIKSAVEESEG